MRRMFVSSTLLAVLSLTVLVSVPPVHSQSKPKAGKAIAAAPGSYGNVDSIGEEEMKIYLYFLASDQLEGRNLPSRGLDTAALYIASHLAEWGLKPGGSTAKTTGPLQPYFMPMELVAKQVLPEQSKASVTAPAVAGGNGGAPPAPSRPPDFEYAKDWSAGGGGRGGPPLEALDVSGNLVFAGNGYVINKTKINPYEGLDAKGEIIVVAGVPAELAAQQAAAGAGRGRGGRGGADAAAGGEAAPGAAPGIANNPGAAAANPLGEACTDFLTPEQYAAKNGALAVVTIANFQQLSTMANPNAAGAFGGFGGGGGGRAGLNGPNYQVPKLQQQPACASVPSVTAGLAMTNSIFQGEKLSAQQVFYGAGSNAKQDSFDLTAAKKIDR